MFIGLFICRPALWDLVISERSSVRTSITCLSAGSTTTGTLILVVSSGLSCTSYLKSNDEFLFSL